MLAIGTHALQDRAAAGVVRLAIVSRRDLETHDQTLQIPLPRRGQRLVEIVEVEDQVSLGRCKGAEVEQVTVATRLHVDAGGRHCGEVMRHQRRGAAQERERAADHASIADRDQLRQPAVVGRLQDRDGIAAPAGRRPFGVAFARHAARAARLPAASLSARGHESRQRFPSLRLGIGIFPIVVLSSSQAHCQGPRGAILTCHARLDVPGVC